MDAKKFLLKYNIISGTDIGAKITIQFIENSLLLHIYIFLKSRRFVGGEIVRSILYTTSF